MQTLTLSSSSKRLAANGNKKKQHLQLKRCVHKLSIENRHWSCGHENG